MTAESQFLTTDEVLEYLHITQRTIYRLIKARKLPAVRIGRQWRFRKRDIDTWLARSRPRADGQQDVRRRVLVVDDDLAVCQVVGRMLEGPYEVEVVLDGRTAVERLEQSAFDLLITDLKMPGMDGLSVIRAVRSTSDIPILIITGHSTEASAIEAVNLGVSGYLTKPFRLPRILSLAAKALGEPPPTVGA